MASSSIAPDRAPEETGSPGQDDFDRLIEREFSPGDEAMMEERARKGAAEDANGAKAPSRDDLSQAEKHESTVGHGYSKTGSQQNKTLWGRFSRNQKIFGGLGFGLIGGGIIAFLLLLLPALRLEGYLATIDQRVFAAANNAVNKRVDNLAERYLVTKISAIQKCNNAVSSACRANYAGTGLASSLFNTWQDGRVEDKLFHEWGLEVQSFKKPVNGQYYKIVDVEGKWSGVRGAELTVKDGKLAMGSFEGGSRIFGKDFSKVIRDQTSWDQVLQRRSVRKYLTRKHGVKFWCFFACKQKDAIDNAKISAKTKLQYKLIERVIQPLSPKYGLILKCLTAGDSSICDPNNLEKVGLDRSQFSEKDLQDLEKFSNDLKANPNLRFSQFWIEKTLVSLGMDEAAAKTAASAVPIAGQIYLFLSIIDATEGVKHFIEDGRLSQIAADLNSSQYIEFYTAMRSANDELKAGALSADEAGALQTQFDDGSQPAEQSLVYQAYTNPSSPATATNYPSSIVSLILPRALAASATANPYLCANGQPIPAGLLVCPEKTLNNHSYTIQSVFDNSTAKKVIDGLDLYDKCYTVSAFGYCAFGARPVNIVHPVLTDINWVINGTLGSIFGLAMKTLNALPGINSLFDFVTHETGLLLNSIFNQVFPLPLQADSVGRDLWDGLEAGGELVASEFNKGGQTADGQPYGLGGKLLTAQEQVGSSTAFLEQQQYDDNQGIYSRIASIDNPNSLLSRFVAVMPSSWSQLSSGAMSFLSQPFSHLGSIFHPAYAAIPITDVNAFGVPRFGYTANDSAFTADPSIYTPQYCDQLNKTWQASKTQDPVTGIDEYSTSNPCLLEQVSVEAASSAFTGNDSLN